jgi:hypothetical protein
LLLAGVLVAMPVVSCGDDDEPAKTVTVEHEVTVENPPAPRKHRQKSRPQPPATTAAPEFVDCDPNIEAKLGTTTCPFAENVFWAYWTSGESSSLEVWSPAAQASFATRCDGDGSQVICTTRDKGAVRFPQAAVDSYSQAQAEAYASTHDLGPDPYEGFSSRAPPSNGGGGGAGGAQDCQGYDPCITPGADVDCADGSGNGPRYVDGPVYVNGDDPYGLDSNYDGVGCE